MPKYFYKKAGTHEANRKKICVWCFRKENRCKTSKFVEIIPQGKIEEMINVHISYNAAAQNHLPNAICNGCLRNLYRMKNETSDNVQKPDFSRFDALKKSRTASQLPCICTICRMIKTPLINKLSIQQQLPMGGKITKGNCTAGANRKTTSRQKVCTHCLTSIARGKRHNCKPSSRVDNIKLMIQQTVPKGKDQILSSLLKEKVNKMGSQKVHLSQRAGKRLEVTVNSSKEKVKETLLSADDILKIQTSFGFTQNETLGIASIVRYSARNRKIIESNLKRKLSARVHSLDEFFGVKNFDFIKTKANEQSVEKRSAVYCKDLNGLIKWVKQKREVDDVHLKFSIDGGGDFLKLCLSIQSIQEADDPQEAGRQKYQHGAASKQFLDSGVKKLLVIGMAQSTQENYSNVSQLWFAIDINTSLNNFKGTIATDLKLANILSGIMAHSSGFPCTYCIAPKDNLIENAELRTIGMNLNNYSEWLAAGGAPKSAKLYKCCTHAPIFTGDPNIEIIAILPPPELHLLIGVVNTIFNKMVTEFTKESWAWAESYNVEREIRNGSSGFDGNACKKLLERVDDLRALCPVGCLKYVRVFQDFHRVVKGCFSRTLDSNYEKYINDFRKSYLDLGISTTPKVHTVFNHVGYYCSKSGKGLGFFSEQAAESVHSDFKKVWVKYAVSMSNSEYPKHLLRAICDYNGLHV